MIKTINKKEFVLKRDGKLVPFDREKIILAISKAGFVDDIVKNKIALEVENISKKFSYIDVETIQDIVEKKLMSSAYKEVAREYIRYRYKRELLREHSKTQQNILEIVEAKNEYVNGENSNKNPQILSTQRDYIAGEVSKDITMRLLLPSDVVQAHKEGVIHFHDSDYMIQTMHNCCLVNLDDMLQNGTVISKTLIESPHSFHTACNVATQIMAQVASNQYGGQSVSLSHLAPFVDVSRRKIHQQVQSEMRWGSHGEVEPSIIDAVVERRVREEVKKGVQTIQYQVNTLMTTNGLCVA